ncbi:SDR family NAD(P)-dependent oxidoreductase [Streptomyces erythrochromogenes]|uniref:SDR family NAD(P)-dependent oxidoreductase n=1 Tax=Streptomyces erythrochromogenes TaxID=285574 RepID=UPI0036CC1BEB
MLVAGATGALGGLAATELDERGALVALAGRNTGRLAARAAQLGGRPAHLMDAYDTDGCAALVPWALDRLGGLNGVLVTVGVAGFGLAQEVPDMAAEHVFQVNMLCPAAILRPAVTFVADGGFLAAVTGAIVETPMRGTADYAAAKTALSCWLSVLAREVRGRGLRVFDFRLPHLDTGFSDRPVTGRELPLAAGADPAAAVHTVVDQLAGVAPSYDAPPRGAPKGIRRWNPIVKVPGRPRA